MSLPDVVRRWQAGWGHVRGFAPPVERDGVLRVELGEASRDREFIVLDAESDPWSIDRAASSALREPVAWVTVPTPEVGRTVDRLAEHGLRSPAAGGGPEWLMTLPALRDQRRTAAPAGYSVVVEESRPGAFVARVTDAEGEIAASGQLGLVAGVAVPDKIVVEPAHRRRRLGGAMMGALVDRALAAGAEEGLLMASTEGRALYESLGWTTLTPVVLGMMHEP